MDIVLTGRHIDLTDAIRNQVTEKLQRVSRLVSDSAKAEVVLAVEKYRQKIEITLHTHGKMIHAESVTSDLYGSLDLVVDKLERQIHRFKDKFISNRTSQRAEDVLPHLDSTRPFALPSLVKTKKFPVKSMSLEDAIVQMELLDKDFFLYLEPASSSMRLLYRRRDGSLGQIEPV